MRIVSTSLVTCGLLICGAGDLRAQSINDELKRMSLQDLLQVEVTTVSRQPEPTSRVPAAVYVITQADIRRSGATTIPEALRLAPGIQVARIDGGRWSIGIRGFADRLARSMLVLMDGRAVYSPLFAGTYWETQDTLLEDIDRIEIIRGPGGTLWGANAVNGVINIITKPASATQGVIVRSGAGAGASGQGFVGFQYGGTARDGQLQFRTYGKAIGRGHEHHADGLSYDDWRRIQAGFRSDWTLTNRRTLTVQGDAYDMRLGERPVSTSFRRPFAEPSSIEAPLSGGNVLARLTGPLKESASFQLQAYYDRTNRREIPVAEDRDTIDIDVQLTHRQWVSHALTWGAGYRVTSGRIETRLPTQFFPDNRTDQLFSGFLRDEVTLAANRLRASIGAKLEHNAYTGVEVQPSARLVWTPRPAHTLLWSVTRAVRTPSRVETDYTTSSFLAVDSLPLFVRLLPNQAFKAEKLIAYEMGYRVRPATNVYVTFSGFFNQLNDTLSTEILTPFIEPAPVAERIVIPVQFANGLHGHSHGAEVTADVRPASWWRWTTNYSYLRIALSRNEGSRDAQERQYEGMSPRHQLQVQSSFDLPRRWSVDWLFRYVSALRAEPIPAYATSDVRVAWQVTPQLEIAAVGQNLHHAHHVEWPNGSGEDIGIARSAYLQFTWHR